MFYKKAPGELLRRKWNQFEELRLWYTCSFHLNSITAQAKRLAGYTKHLETMYNHLLIPLSQQENNILKKEYDAVVNANVMNLIIKQNHRVTTLMKDNESFTLGIQSKRMEFKQLWNKKAVEHKRFLADSDLKVECNNSTIIFYNCMIVWGQ